MEKIYYQAPSDKLFEEMKKKAIAIWRLLDGDEYEEAEAVQRIEAMENISDNFMTILAMFDEGNQQDLLEHASQELREAVRIRIESVQ